MSLFVLINGMVQSWLFFLLSTWSLEVKWGQLKLKEHQPILQLYQLNNYLNKLYLYSLTLFYLI